MAVTVAAIYQFISPKEPLFSKWKPVLLSRCQELGIRGSLLIAEEGLNGTISGDTPEAVREIKHLLETHPIFKGYFSHLSYKESYATQHPFYRMKVKLKKEIVTLGVSPEAVNPTQNVGQYVAPKDWNDLIQDPNTILVDTRNQYETAVGTFKNAIDPKTKHFRDFPKFVETFLKTAENKNKKIAMFCTGGIRCEKSTSYLLSQGFAPDQVYHLSGGILKYLEEIPVSDSLWEGECFVFDHRVSVQHALKLGEYVQCHACRHPVSQVEQASEQYQQGLSCPHCYETQTEQTKARVSERHKQIVISKKYGIKHLGRTQERNINYAHTSHDDAF